MVASPLWFGVGGQFGWLHVPAASSARAGVVLCPPFGTEHAWSYATYRLLAEDLESCGFTVLRFDYEGTGQSANLHRAWPTGGLVASVVGALEVLQETGVTLTAVVGMRLGATLAGVVASQGGVDRLVLWDPVLSGREFLREQRARVLFDRSDPESPADPEDGAIIPGAHLTHEAVAELRDLAFSRTPTGPKRPCLTLIRPGFSARRKQLLQTAFDPTWVEASDQDDLFQKKAIPMASLGTVRKWLDTTVPAEYVPVRAPHSARRSWTVARDDGGGAIVEHPEALGPHGLFGVVTEPAAAPVGPTVVFLETAAEPPVGPGRLWVDLSRELASAGVRSVRANVSGIGDSPARVGRPRNAVYAPEAPSDVVEIAEAVSPEDPSRVVLVGLCSGAYNALEAGARLGAVGVCAVNPILDAPTLNDRPAGELVRLVAQPRSAWARAIGSRPGVDGLRLAIPEWAWHLLDGFRVVRSPARGLKPLIGKGTRLLLICGPEDATRFTRRGGWITRRLSRSGRLRFEEIADLDHSLLYPAAQGAVSTLLREHLTTVSQVKIQPRVGEPTGWSPPPEDGPPLQNHAEV